jgi:hypothetical protein
MSYSSYGYIPCLDNYTEAFKVFSTTEPIRGSKPVRVPLGRRSDSNKFGISKDLNGDIHLSLYGHTGIVFHQPTDSADSNTGTLTIGDTSGKRQWRWSSCDSYFILSVLGRYIKNARTDRGRLVLETRDDQKFVLESKGNLTLTYTIGNADQSIYNRTRTLTPVPSSNPVLHTYRLNRQATNNVRARYGEFYRYMKGLIGVRKELQQHSYYDRPSGETVIDEYYAILFTGEELMGVIPTVTESHRIFKATEQRFDPDNPMVDCNPTDKPPMLSIRYEQFDLDNNESGYRQVETRDRYNKWVASTQAFLSLISVPTSDPDQHEKFRQAFVWLGHFTGMGSYRSMRADAIRVEVGAMQKTIDEIIFKWHSEEVIERVPAKPNTVPSARYMKWVTRERD